MFSLSATASLVIWKRTRINCLKRIELIDALNWFVEFTVKAMNKWAVSLLTPLWQKTRKLDLTRSANFSGAFDLRLFLAIISSLKLLCGVNACYYYQQEVIQRSRLIYIYKMTQFSKSFWKFNRPSLIVIFEKLIMQSRFRNHLAWFISHRCYINFSLAQLARS